MAGQTFVEWGCGFGVVTGVASLSGMDSVGIEVESELCEAGRQLLASRQISAQIWKGNFLPIGAGEMILDDEPQISCRHTASSAYESQHSSLHDFAAVFAYPWPGEEHFIKRVFSHFARAGTILLLFRGPFHLELYRKI